MSYSLQDLLRSAGTQCPERAELLWAQYREGGDEAAFAALVGWYGSGIYRRIVFAVGFAHPIAEEAFQAALAKLHAHRHDAACRTFAGALAWLRTTAANEARMAVRAHRRARAREAAAAVDARTAAVPDAADEAIRAEVLAELAAAFGRLRPEQREALALRFFEGLTLARAAEAAGCNRETLARRVEQGLERLRALLTSRGVVTGLVAGAVLADAARAAAPAAGRVAAMAAAARLLRPPAGAAGWVKKAAVLLGVAAAGGAAAGGWLATRPDDPPPLAGVEQPTPEVAKAERPAPQEAVPDRNLRVFRAEVLPRQLSALRPLSTTGGAVLVSVVAHDTWVQCRYDLGGTPATTPPRHSRVEFVHNTLNRYTHTYLDAGGLGDGRRVDPTRALVLGRNPFTGQDLVVESVPLQRAVEAFRTLPSDELTAAEARADAPRLRDSLQPFLGRWHVGGDSANTMDFNVHPAGGLDAVPPDRRTVDRRELSQVWVDPQGRAHGLPYTIGPVTLDTAGRRATIGGTDVWWSREPVAGE